jgi:calcineurin-like phosphoesterase family protein
MKNTWFTSDRHAFHGNIIKYCNRPFINPLYPDLGKDTDKRRWDWAAMNEALLDHHNELVKPGDDVYDLGDFAFGRDATEEGVRSFLRRLNGNLYFLWGNHDELIKEVARKNPELFTWFSKDMSKRNNPILEFKQGDIDIILCHYSLRTWNHSHKGSYHLYGHTHCTLPEDDSLSFDCGVDGKLPIGTPYHLDEVIKRMETKKKNRKLPQLPVSN